MIYYVIALVVALIVFALGFYAGSLHTQRQAEVSGAIKSWKDDVEAKLKKVGV